MKEKIVVGYSSSYEYMTYLPVQIFTVLENNQDCDFEIYILCDSINEFAQENIKKVVMHFKDVNVDIHYHEVDDSFFDGKLPKWHGSYATLYSLLYEQLLSDVSKILFFNIDTIVFGSLKEYWNTDLTNCLWAGANDDFLPDVLQKVNKKYNISTNVNCSSIILNLDGVRNEGVTTDFFLRNLKHEVAQLHADQGIYNLVLGSRTKFVDKKYSYMFTMNPYCDLQFKKDFNAGKVIVLATYNGANPWEASPFFYSTHYYWKCFDRVKAICGGSLGFEKKTRLWYIKNHKFFKALCPKFLYHFIIFVSNKIGKEVPF
ncbi:MAG: hypothetical protein LBQ41_02635 [Candidatus Ancillula sp.]|jgi:lipopolysaccharide biosynthesis glycosyltransferase|nr:hypothetical protein [Candidatus Ancillula sp.]